MPQDKTVYEFTYKAGDRLDRVFPACPNRAYRGLRDVLSAADPDPQVGQGSRIRRPHWIKFGITYTARVIVYAKTA